MPTAAAWPWVKRGVRSKRKESERTVAPILLGQLDLSGKVVTGDALYAQRDLSRQVVEQGGSYLWVLKDNQPAVKEAVSLLFAEPPWGEEFSKAGQRGRHGDRQERRRLRASSALNGYLEWPCLGQVCCMERTRIRKGTRTVELAYAITSLTPEEAGPARLLRLWRGHWRIENRLHWVRDVTFDEDRSQVRTGAVPQVMAAFRNAVIGLLRRTGTRNIAAALRHYAWKPLAALNLLGFQLP